MVAKVNICGVNTAKLPVLSEKEKTELIYKIKDGDQKAKEEFINGKEDIEKILNTYKFNPADDKQAWFDNIKKLSGDLGYASEVKTFKENPGAFKAHVGDVSTVLRIALTGRTNTPDMYEIMQVLGEEKINQRFKEAIAKLN